MRGLNKLPQRPILIVPGRAQLDIDRPGLDVLVVGGGDLDVVVIIEAIISIPLADGHGIEPYRLGVTWRKLWAIPSEIAQVEVGSEK